MITKPKKTNELIRESLRKNKVYQWQLAEQLGIAEYTLTRMFRHELPEEQQRELCKMIEKIKEGRDKS